MTTIHHHNNRLHPSIICCLLPIPNMQDPRIQDHGDDDDGRITNRNDGDHQELLQFRAGHDHDSLGSDDSGFCSPPLWKNSPSPSQPLLLSQHVYTSLSLSPKSRLQAITRGQRELMEMARSLPESSYELSLKDLVEHHRMETTQKEALVEKTLDGSKQRARGVVKAVRRQESKRSERRSGSFEMENRGLFLKMGFPFSVKSKKKNNSSFASSGKVSPRPDGIKSSGGGGGGERDWWKKKFTGSSDSYSSRTSNNSGSSSSSSSSSSASSTYNSRKKKASLEGCWPLFQSRRSKSGV